MRAPTLAEGAAHLAAELPRPLLEQLADALDALDGQPWDTIQRRLLGATPQPHFRAHVEAFLTLWHTTQPCPPAPAVALSLRAAAATAYRYRDQQVTELIWTGPEAAPVPLRRTDQALLQVIAGAQRELLVVSFAIYGISAIRQALVVAVTRGVRLRICLETPDAGSRLAYDTVHALGAAVAQHAELYIWPTAQRPIGANGKAGSLHAKCAVADAHLLFLSSANLTDYAITRNIELGILVQGGLLPAQVRTQFERLIQQGSLRPLPRA